MQDQSSYAQPAASEYLATTIHTPDTGLETGMAYVQNADEAMRVYWAKPAQALHALPVIILISDFFGLHARIADVARRYAREGY